MKPKLSFLFCLNYFRFVWNSFGLRRGPFYFKTWSDHFSCFLNAERIDSTAINATHLLGKNIIWIIVEFFYNKPQLCRRFCPGHSRLIGLTFYYLSSRQDHRFSVNQYKILTKDNISNFQFYILLFQIYHNKLITNTEK